jgi:hypothetical protein
MSRRGSGMNRSEAAALQKTKPLWEVSVPESAQNPSILKWSPQSGKPIRKASSYRRAKDFHSSLRKQAKRHPRRSTQLGISRGSSSQRDTDERLSPTLWFHLRLMFKEKHLWDCLYDKDDETGSPSSDETKPFITHWNTESFAKVTRAQATLNHWITRVYASTSFCTICDTQGWCSAWFNKLIATAQWQAVRIAKALSTTGTNETKSLG